MYLDWRLVANSNTFNEIGNWPWSWKKYDERNQPLLFFTNRRNGKGGEVAVITDISTPFFKRSPRMIIFLQIFIYLCFFQPQSTWRRRDVVDIETPATRCASHRFPYRCAHNGDAERERERERERESERFEERLGHYSARDWHVETAIVDWTTLRGRGTAESASRRRQRTMARPGRGNGNAVREKKKGNPQKKKSAAQWRAYGSALDNNRNALTE